MQCVKYEKSITIKRKGKIQFLVLLSKLLPLSLGRLSLLLLSLFLTALTLLKFFLLYWLTILSLLFFLGIIRLAFNTGAFLV